MKNRALQVIEALPEDATLGEILETLKDLAPESAEHSSGQKSPLPEGGVWDLLEQAAGTVEMPRDWASEHDHHLYGTPRRSSAP